MLKGMGVRRRVAQKEIARRKEKELEENATKSKQLNGNCDRMWKEEAKGRKVRHRYKRVAGVGRRKKTEEEAERWREKGGGGGREAQQEEERSVANTALVWLVRLSLLVPERVSGTRSCLPLFRAGCSSEKVSRSWDQEWEWGEESCARAKSVKKG